MAYIYALTNKHNGKQYVGKTEHRDPKDRFKEHLRESRKERNENRPLHRAINKYGEEAFIFEVLEDVPSEQSYEREIYWIATLGTYGSTGYNATKGGDGKSFLNYKKIIKDYNRLQNAAATARINDCHEDSVVNILNQYDIPIKQYPNQKRIQTNFEGQELVFNSITEAANWLIINGKTTAKLSSVSGSISRVVNGKRQSYLQAKWEVV